MPKTTVASLEERFDAFETSVNDRLDTLENDLTTVGNELDALRTEYEGVIGAIGVEQQDQTYYLAEVIHKVDALKDFAATNRKSIRALFAQQGQQTQTTTPPNGDQARQPTRTGFQDVANVEIQNLNPNDPNAVKCTRSGCDQFHGSKAQVKACFAQHYANRGANA